jgi:hypothetical protein
MTTYFLRRGAALALAGACTACGSFAVQGGPGAGDDGVWGGGGGGAEFVFILEGDLEAVWVEMRQVLRQMGIRLEEEELDLDRGRLRSGVLSVPPQELRCTGPDGVERTRMGGASGVLTAHLRREGVYRTRATLAVELRDRSGCTSRGTLERRIVERTEAAMWESSQTGSREHAIGT